MLAAMYEKSEQDRVTVMAAAVGDEVCTPRGGEPGFVAAVLPDGGRLVTSDGDLVDRIQAARGQGPKADVGPDQGRIPMHRVPGDQTGSRTSPATKGVEEEEEVRGTRPLLGDGSGDFLASLLDGLEVEGEDVIHLSFLHVIDGLQLVGVHLK